MPSRKKTMFRSDHNFAHVKTAEVSWNVHICEQIVSLVSKLEQEELLQYLNCSKTLCATPDLIWFTLLSQSKYHTAYSTWLYTDTAVILSRCGGSPQVDMKATGQSIAYGCRLLHSSARVAGGPLVGYETWPPIGWCCPLHYWLI